MKKLTDRQIDFLNSTAKNCNFTIKKYEECKEPKFKVGDWVVLKHEWVSYKVNSYEYMDYKDRNYTVMKGFFYALHDYEYMVSESLLELWDKTKNER
jgi:NADPH-dependent curcumin reductase CurA